VKAAAASEDEAEQQPAAQGSPDATQRDPAAAAGADTDQADRPGTVGLEGALSRRGTRSEEGPGGRGENPRNLEHKKILQAFPDFSLLLISSSMEFLSVRAVPKYLNSSTLSKDLLSVFML
jgi:hypothetical protein